VSSAPLEGIKVIALEQAVSAPYASRQLADLGAEVIKIERPEGDFARYYDNYVSGTSSFFVWVNRSKSSLVLDLKDAADRERIETLLAEADVFIVNLAPAAAQRLGLSAGQVGERYPRIVACEITGYGAGGPRSDDKAYDLAIQAEAGAMSVTGDADASKVGFSAADIAAGSFAFSGILAALVRRGRTGEGAVVSVSMLDALAEWISAPLLAAHYGPGQPPRSGRRHAAIAPYGTFQLSDDTTIMIAIQNDREFAAFANGVLADPAMATDERFATAAARIANVEVLEATINHIFTGIDATETRRRLNEAKIAIADVNTLAQVWEHEQLRARNRFVCVEGLDGPVEVLKFPVEFQGFEPDYGPIPKLGQQAP
jgi:crotonobetainyl-CoA:carnitine CoA-transferase CaiB-like acyl-CoA transferase